MLGGRTALMPQLPVHRLLRSSIGGVCKLVVQQDGKPALVDNPDFRA